MANKKAIPELIEIRDILNTSNYLKEAIATVQSPACSTTVWRRNNSKEVLFTPLERAK